MKNVMKYKLTKFGCILTELILIFISSSNCYGRGNKGKYIPKWKKQACELPQSQNDQSHYICDASGDVKCLPGWQGDLCDVPMCRKGCDPMNGYCQRPDECRCKLGFYGEKCNKCIPLPGCQHGYCNVSFECKCNKGWTGIFCSEPICRKDCHSTRGYCEIPGECRCRLGWTGPNCNHCQVLPGCQFGSCVKPLECKCLPGYAGLLCQFPICSKTCDRQHGYCRRPGECRCKVGWMGENCTQCHPYPGCVNGHCNNPWECLCKPGWGGVLCDEPLNYCELNPDTCENGGECFSLEKADGNFRCLCSPGYAGKKCEIHKNSAAVNQFLTSTIAPQSSNVSHSQLNTSLSTTKLSMKPTSSNKTMPSLLTAPNESKLQSNQTKLINLKTENYTTQNITNDVI